MEQEKHPEDRTLSTPSPTIPQYSNSADGLRAQTLSDVIQECRRAYGQRELDAGELASVLPTWLRVLAAIPTFRLMELCVAAIQQKGGSYPVGAQDIYEQWDKPEKARRKATEANQSWLSETFHVQQGMRTPQEEEDRKNAFQRRERERRAAAAERERYFQELEARGELPDMPPDVFDRTRIGEMPSKELSDSEILELLRIRCNMDSRHRQALDFGRWLLKQFSSDLWTYELAAEQWTRWQIEQGAVAV